MRMQTFDLPLDECQLKFDKGDGAGTFEGYASVFNKTDLDGDTVVKGAFASTIAAHKKLGTRPGMFFGHSPGRPLGIWKHLQEDNHGLFAKGEFTMGNSDAQNVRASVIHGAVNGLSIGFIPRDSEPKEDNSGRILKAIDLVEISVVSFPADPLARVTDAKSAIVACEDVRDFEGYLRDAGFSRTEAKTLLSAYRDVVLRDAVPELTAEIAALKSTRIDEAILDRLRRVAG